MYRMTKVLQKSIEKNNHIQIPSLIIDKIVREGEISRIALSKELDVTKTIISKKVNELIANGILVETGKGNNAIGKKEILLDLNRKYKNILVVDFSKNNLTLGIYNFKKETIFEKTVEYPKPEEIAGILEKVITEHSSKKAIDIAVLSVPMIVRGLKVFTLSDSNISGVYEEAKKYCFENYFKVKVFNDTELESIAVKTCDKFKDLRNIVILSAHYGIGGSIIMNNDIVYGENRIAGEFGLLNPVVKDDGKIENFQDRNSLKAMYEKYKEEKSVNITLNEFKDIIKQGDELVEKYYDKLIKELSLVLINIGVVIDINAFILSGDLFELYDGFFEKLNDKIIELSNINNFNIVTCNDVNKSLVGAKVLGINYTVESYFEQYI